MLIRTTYFQVLHLQVIFSSLIQISFLQVDPFQFNYSNTLINLLVNHLGVIKHYH
jgi:hypothetical protein